MDGRSVKVLSLACCLLMTVAAEAQTVVSRVKVQNAADQPLKDALVRGSLPLPVTFDKPIECLALRDGPSVLPTQVSILSTYPGFDKEHPLGRPEVVQLAAKVPLLPAKGYKELDVILLDPPPAPAGGKWAGGESLREALAGGTPGRTAPVVVEAADCFGNRYRAEPLAKAHLIETHQSGPLLRESVYQAILTPAGKSDPDKPALKRFLRVRAYLTQYAGEPFASLAVVIHNGSIDHPNGHVFYRDIRVGVAEPLGLEVWQKNYSPAAEAKQQVQDGYLWQPCPAADAGGKVFVMPPRAAAVLRTFVYSPAGKERVLASAANPPLFVPVPSQEGFSWSNFATARYGASKYPMPLSLPSQVQAQMEKDVQRDLGTPAMGAKLEYLSKGPLERTPRLLGHAMPAGVPYGGMTGGAGIQYVFGIEAAVTGHHGALQSHVVLADRAWDRHHAYRFYDDGRPYQPGGPAATAETKPAAAEPADDDDDSRLAKVKPGGKLEIGQDPACQVQAKYVADNRLLSTASETLLKYMNHDDQHLARTFDIIPAAFLACDPVSRDRVVTLGGQAADRLQGWLLAAKRYADANPHQGTDGFARAHGWLLHAMSCAFYVCQDAATRKQFVEIARLNAEVVEKAQRPDGVIAIHKPFSKILNGEYWAVHTWQSVGIVADGTRCAVGILSSPENQKCADGLQQAYARFGKWATTVGWVKDLNGPSSAVGLRLKDAKADLPQPYVRDDKISSSNYFGSPYAWFYEITGEKHFLDRISDMAGGHVEATALKRNMLPMWSYALWLAQGGRIPGREAFTPSSNPTTQPAPATNPKEPRKPRGPAKPEGG